ncbi:MAG: molybdopterin-dependent oxidoreductase, partial [Chloroflexi bacterium]|nr:molybdopterin-dependent oxidoreductase [Chloroflexota bacterium]
MARVADVQIKKATCFQCLQNCGRLVHVGPNGKIVSVEADYPGHPVQPQKPPCSKGTIVKEFHDSPRRINYPLKRVGKRGHGEWQRLTWDEAMDEIAAKLAEIRDKYGPEALFVNGGTVHSDGDWAAMRWCNLFGTANYIYQGKNCGSARLTTAVAVWGYGGGGGPGTKCAILSGVNPGESLMGWNGAIAMKERGAKLIVVDPRRTEIAKLADMYIPIRPATDAALFLGMINVVLNEDLWDHEFVEKWVLGFDELVRVAKKYPPERAAEICWTDKDLIIQAARDFATLKPASLQNGVATTHIGGYGGITATLAQCALTVITGNFNNIGRPIPREALAWHDEMHWDTLVNHPLRTRDNVSADRFPVGSVKAYQLSREAMKKVNPEGYNAGIYFIGPSQSMTWKAILDEKPYPIKAVITEGGNPLCT